MQMGRDRGGEHMNEVAASIIKDQAIRIMEGALNQLEERGGLVSVRSEAQVQKAVDLLRFSQVDSTLLRTAEFLSCAMFEMNGFLRQGRVNAYQSKALRVRNAFAATIQR